MVGTYDIPDNNQRAVPSGVLTSFCHRFHVSPGGTAQEEPAMPRKPKDSGKLTPSVKTVEGRQKIVEWMLFDETQAFEGYWIDSFSVSVTSVDRIISVWDVQPVIKQLRDGQWPDDDTALLEWWNTGGKNVYRDVKQQPNKRPMNKAKDDRLPEPGAVCGRIYMGGGED